MKTSLSRFNFALGIFILLSLVYSLFYNGLFSTDDEHILSTQALSIAFDGEMNFSRVIGNGRVFSYSQFTDPYADQALNIEPAQALFGSLLVKVAATLGIGRVQTLFLLTIWATAVTAAVIFLTVLRMGYPWLTALAAAIIFGLGTIVFPYSRTYFRDPLAMMFLACAWYFLCAVKQDLVSPKMDEKRVFYWLGLMVFLAAGALAKNIVLIAVPVVILDVFIALRRSTFSNEKYAKTKSKRLKWITLAAAVIVALICWFVLIPSIPLLARFTPDYYSLLAKFFKDTPRPYFFEAVIGPFISPGKSIFIFSPILILTIPGLILRFKSSWQAWACLMLMIIGQALFYDFEWSGHINWGIRYLLPVVPLLLLTAVPAIDRMLRTRLGKVILCLLGVLSVGVQFLGVLVPVGNFYRAMYTAVEPVSEWSTIWQAQYSILTWNAKWLLSGQQVDIALARFSEKITLFLVIAVVIAVCMVLCLSMKRLKKYLWIFLVGSLVFNFYVAASFRNDETYGAARSDLRESYRYLTQQADPGDAVLIRSYGTPVWFFWMNWAGPQFHWTALPYYFPIPSLIEKYTASGNPEDALDDNTKVIIETSMLPGSSLWLLLPSDSPGANLELEKVWLTSRTISVSCTTFNSETEHTEVCRFIIPPLQ